MEQRKLSMYCKEELPTWDEFYHKFFMYREYIYDPKFHSSYVDPYWRKPYKKLLIGWCCNQLNKMITEDGYESKVLKYLSTVMERKPVKVFFRITVGKHDECTVSKGDLHLFGPDVYRQQLPDGTWSIFRNKDVQWMNMFGDFNDHDQLYLGISIISESVRDDLKEAGFLPKEYIYSGDDRFHKVMEIMVKEVYEYFKDSPGWKDPNGNLLPTEPREHACMGAGADAAL